MTQESIQPVLDWISAHPGWSGFVVFLISLSESLAIVGLMVPGVVMMTAIGGMMGAGVLPFFETLGWAILGAIAGDGISYWLGYHYHQRLREYWPFRRFPALLARGETFFKNHGGKSIIFGRFVGPVRPMIPVIAGMMDMSPRRFLFFNVFSALVWAPLYSLPGILIGASLGALSPEVASRAGILVLLFLLICWLFYEGLVLLGAWIAKTIHKGINSLWDLVIRIFPSLHWIFKTAQGTEQSQLGIALLFLLATLSFIITTQDVLNGNGIAAWNEPVYHLLRALYSDKMIAWMGLLTGMGEPWVLLPAAAAIGVRMLRLRQWNTAFYWLMTIGLGFYSGVLIKILTLIPRPEGLLHSSHSGAFPSGHALTATLVYGFTAVLSQATLIPSHRWIPWAISVPLILSIAFSRVYLGMHWFSDIIGSLSLGIAFVAFGTFMLRRFESKTIPLRTILVPGILFLSLTLSLYSILYYPKLRTQLLRHWPTYELQTALWWKGEGPTNGLYRSGAFKRQATVFDVQWLGSLNSVQKTLEKAGWLEIPTLTVKNSVILLARDPAPKIFPLMPKFHHDRLPVLRLAKILDGTHRVVLQLWQSDYQNVQKVPLWVGTLRLEEAAHPLPLVSTYLEQPDAGDMLIQELIKTLHKISNSHTRLREIWPSNATGHPVVLIMDSIR